MSDPRILLVDDNESVLVTLQEALKINGFEVVAASGVNDALRYIAADRFDVLLSDLHMPGPGDGLTVVSAMRNVQPHAVTLVYSGYPEMRAAANAILLQADEILVKPLSVPDLVEIIREKLQSRKRSVVRVAESVAKILESDNQPIIDQWMTRVSGHKQLMLIPLSFQERSGHLPQLLRDLVARLRRPHTLEGRNMESATAHEHGKMRRAQGYSAALLVEESRILQVSIFQTLQNNLARVDFSLVLVDVMTIADEVDSQLCQAMQTFMAEPEPAVVAA
ncbi:MAG: response regulator receiver protein [Candidatus Angelobacter sp.]|nr:response regulator receiver protein [Candidatus Angelobacter sp.]